MPTDQTSWTKERVEQMLAAEDFKYLGDKPSFYTIEEWEEMARAYERPSA